MKKKKITKVGRPKNKTESINKKNTRKASKPKMDTKEIEAVYLTSKELEVYLKISRPSINELIENRGFPSGLAVGERKRIWKRSEVDAWFDGVKK